MSSSTPNKEPPNLENLPLEVRHMIYKALLPRPRLIHLIRDNRTATVGSLIKTCRWMHKEIIEWLEMPRIAQTYVKTPKYGIIDINATIFKLEVNLEHRDYIRHYCRFRQECSEERCLKKIPLEVPFRNASRFIRNFVLHFKIEDAVGDDWGPNWAALTKVWQLPNLQRLDILIGDSGKAWPWSSAILQQLVKDEKSEHPEVWRLVPLSCRSGRYLSRPTSLQAAVRIWDMGSKWNNYRARQLLIEYNSKQDTVENSAPE